MVSEKDVDMLRIIEMMRTQDEVKRKLKEKNDEIKSRILTF